MAAMPPQRENSFVTVDPTTMTAYSMDRVDGCRVPALRRRRRLEVAADASSNDEPAPASQPSGADVYGRRESGSPTDDAERGGLVVYKEPVWARWCRRSAIRAALAKGSTRCCRAGSSLVVRRRAHPVMAGKHFPPLNDVSANPASLPALDEPTRSSPDARRDVRGDGHALVRGLASAAEVAAYRPVRWKRPRPEADVRTPADRRARHVLRRVPAELQLVARRRGRTALRVRAALREGGRGSRSVSTVCGSTTIRRCSRSPAAGTRRGTRISSTGRSTPRRRSRCGCRSPISIRDRRFDDVRDRQSPSGQVARPRDLRRERSRVRAARVERAAARAHVRRAALPATRRSTRAGRSTARVPTRPSTCGR